MECNYFYYDFQVVIRAYERDNNISDHFEKFDQWDILILIDISNFLATILTLIIFTTLHVNDSVDDEVEVTIDKKKSDSLKKRKPKQKRKVDFMEDQIDEKKKIVLTSNKAITGTFYLFYIFYDHSQDSYIFQWIIAAMELLNFFAVYCGKNTQKYANYLRGFKDLVIVIGGCYIWHGHGLEMRSDEPRYFLASNFIKFIVPLTIYKYIIDFLQSFLQHKYKQIERKLENDDYRESVRLDPVNSKSIA